MTRHEIVSQEPDPQPDPSHYRFESVFFQMRSSSGTVSTVDKVRVDVKLKADVRRGDTLCAQCSSVPARPAPASACLWAFARGRRSAVRFSRLVSFTIGLLDGSNSFVGSLKGAGVSSMVMSVSCATAIGDG